MTAEDVFRLMRESIEATHADAMHVEYVDGKWDFALVTYGVYDDPGTTLWHSASGADAVSALAELHRAATRGE